MGERKVLNKYHPADFDPAKIPRRRQPKNQHMKVRNMLPLTIRCNKCGHYMYKGTKINCRKELAGDSYLGIPIYRFYFNCTSCSAEVVIKTDPKNSDYVVEAGAKRNFEPWQRAQDEEDELGNNDIMKLLESRMLDSKREMDIAAAINESKSMNSRRAKVSVDKVLEVVHSRGSTEEGKGRKKLVDEEEDALVKSVFNHKRKDHVRRIHDDVDDEASKDARKRCKVSDRNSLSKHSSSSMTQHNVEIVVKRRK